jgi:tryptophan synthase alpha chain
MTHEASLESLLRHRRAKGQKLFLPYVTAGLPSPQRFVELVSEVSSFADAIEVGIPFSDPIMDGPVIQEASARALQGGVNVMGALEMIREALRHAWIPVVIMCYYNPIHKMGKGFVDELARSGTQALIVPDLPYEEASDLDGLLKDSEIALVQMVGPTTPEPRAAKLAKASRAFVYAVSRLGVTGVRDSLDEAASPVVERVRSHTDLPVLLGIGISTADQARQAARVADGVIVGSAIMKKVIAGDVSGAVTFCKEIRQALDQGGK